ncbi:MAG: aminodeoxychorismate lyase [Gallionellales bacterium RIFCSPLOWO2_02_FULL_57_47]|nr:MAG: aminodeoxychorismate lyase [Gallionellales bacterium RIFCSPLOWO2_02_FULL_57_47]OGT17665.1 MAG: aminodeoxychorismate lyase [Gallionellales bacterium RIFCSPHIGHO2_02_FULL_57_16]
MKRLFARVILLVMLAAAGFGYHVYQPLPLPAAPFAFALKQGSSLKSAARQLKQAGLLEQDLTFVWLARVQGKSGTIKAGNYVLEHPVSRLELLEIIAKGSVSQSQVRVIEGWTFKQLRAALDASPDLSHRTSGLSDAEILQRIGATENHPEGLFFPDTYYFAAGSSDLTIFKVAYHTMQRQLQEAWAARATDLPLETPYQALILASIVEKETGTPADRTMIAGVFANRLRKGMLLQTDPTVIYGLGDKFDGNLRKRDLLADSPYNTYTRRGLTPTPIALPGTAALQAALHPAQTDALYFVARGDGSSQFSSSLTTHNRAVDKYQK